MSYPRRLCVCVLLALAVALAAGCRPQPRALPAATPSPPAPNPARLYPYTVRDARGITHTLAAPPQRIVSMSPPLTETLFALGLGERVVGVTRFCKHPPEAQKKEKIGGVIDPSEEKIVALAPDIVFATVGNPMAVLESLEKRGVRVFSVDPKTYQQVCEMIETVARVCGVPDAGRRVTAPMRRTEEEIRRKVAGLSASARPKALLIVWLEPLYVAGPGTFGDDMLKLCGATNAASGTANPWKEYSLEMAVAANPQVIVIATEHAPGPSEAAETVAKLRKHPSWRTVSAVKRGRIVVVEGDLLWQTGPRLHRGLRALAAGIHPELFGNKEHASASTSANDSH